MKSNNINKERVFLNMQACSLFFIILASTMYLLFRLSFFWNT